MDERECSEVFDVRDASGVVLQNQMRVDGLQVSTFRKPPGVTASIVRNIKHLNLRDDDVILCTPPKSGRKTDQLSSNQGIRCFKLMF